MAPDIEAYFNFVLGMFLAFGVAFEVPVVVVVLVLTGLVNMEQLREFRGYVVVAIFVLAAVHHAAGRGFADLARDPDVHPLRGGHLRRAVHSQAAQGGARRGRPRE